MIGRVFLTMHALRQAKVSPTNKLLEEVEELLMAVKQNDEQAIFEECGDVLWNIAKEYGHAPKVMLTRTINKIATRLHYMKANNLIGDDGWEQAKRALSKTHKSGVN